MQADAPACHDRALISCANQELHILCARLHTDQLFNQSNNQRSTVISRADETYCYDKTYKCGHNQINSTSYDLDSLHAEGIAGASVRKGQSLFKQQLCAYKILLSRKWQASPACWCRQDAFMSSAQLLLGFAR